MDEHELDALCLQVAFMARHIFVEVVGRAQCERELELTDENTGASMFMNLSALYRSYGKPHRNNHGDDDHDDDDDNEVFKLIIGGDPARLRRMAPETLRHKPSYYHVRGVGFDATVESMPYPGEEDHMWSLTFHRIPSNFLSVQVALIDQLISDYFFPFSDDGYEVYDRSDYPPPPPHAPSSSFEYDGDGVYYDSANTKHHDSPGRRRRHGPLHGG